jgi:hypothetical protein
MTKTTAEAPWPLNQRSGIGPAARRPADALQVPKSSDVLADLRERILRGDFPEDTALPPGASSSQT